MLVRAQRASLPAPEDLIDREPQRPERRPGFDDVAWFRMNIGRRQNADPRWILPLICRRGHVTKAEVGAIRIGAGETRFAIPRAIARRFDAAVKRTAGANDDGAAVLIEPVREDPAPPRHARAR